MSFTLQFSQIALKDLKKLPKEVSTNLISSLERIKIRPYDFVQKLTGLKYYRLKVQNYRVILDIKAKVLIILVIRAGHRRNIYKKL